jgi:hypothetical protein
MKAVYYFVLGIREFRQSFTSNPGDYTLAYDWGREWAHRLTFRRFDNA